MIMGKWKRKCLTVLVRETNPESSENEVPLKGGGIRKPPCDKASEGKKKMRRNNICVPETHDYKQE